MFSMVLDDCLTKKVFTWDYDLCQIWTSEVKQIVYSINMEQIYTTKLYVIWIL